MHKTKIICTIGPASDTPEIFRELVLNGLSIARINLSHGDQPYIQHRINVIKQVREELNIPVAILLDTRGPEIRTKSFVDGKATLVAGKEITLYNGDFDGTEESFCITYNKLYKDVSKGNIILLDDGLIELEVIDVKDKAIHCLIKNGGVLKNKKGINVPGVFINLPALTQDDIDDILFGVKLDVDFIAASFIRKASDVLEIKELLTKNGGEGIQIISKIESQEGVDNIDEIIAVSDAIMIARGDLGVEIPTELIPLTQKMIIEKCNITDVPVITATQMLDSMIVNPRPTRAEVSDVANAVLDGTDAIMLSGETAAGAYPIEAVKVMRKVAQASEDSLNYKQMLIRISKVQDNNIANAVSYSTCSTAMNLNAKAIICPTHSGKTVRLIAMFRPSVPIIALTTNERTQRQMQLSWGVIPILIAEETSSDVLFYKSIQKAKSMGLVAPKDLVIITAGIPLGVAGSTNLMKVQEVE
ncbi:MAG: pyruvate kinase [Firmicutes bacterium HGW-Firmicutes-1]|jgi:pyruvate kinase|nr:MAG: pyruvate kinase [Firmicutes bacterium HGW-Firmicutes-1]